MTKIFDGEGHELGELALSEGMLELLERDSEIAIHFHTPQLLRYKLGAHEFSFKLRKDRKRILAEDAGSVRAYIAMQRAIKDALEKL